MVPHVPQISTAYAIAKGHQFKVIDKFALAQLRHLAGAQKQNWL